MWIMTKKLGSLEGEDVVHRKQLALTAFHRMWTLQLQQQDVSEALIVCIHCTCTHNMGDTNNGITVHPRTNQHQVHWKATKARATENGENMKISIPLCKGAVDQHVQGLVYGAGKSRFCQYVERLPQAQIEVVSSDHPCY